jgi:hypothetical protein
VSDADAELVWEFDVITALHADIKLGGEYRRVRSRVLLSRAAFPGYGLASETAGAFAVAVHGGMPVAILPRY